MEGRPESAAATEGTPEPAASRTRATPTLTQVLLYQAAGILLVLLVGGVVFYFWHQGYYFYSTDDAVVSAQIANIASARAGTVLNAGFRVGQYILVGQSIAKIRTDSGTVFYARSPLNGRIISETVMAGEVVTAGQQLAQVVDLGSVYITAYVEETHIKDVHPGQNVDVLVSAQGDRPMRGRVNVIVPATASETSALPTTDYATGNFAHVTQRIPVRITLADEQGATLYPGESASVTIHLHNH
jgi:membrane fusion protein (multidrug efflux system)